MTQQKTIYLSIIAILFVAVLVFLYQKFFPTTQIACTLEAKICPDGTSVGRTGPKCEFATCPEPMVAIFPSPTDTPEAVTNPALHYRLASKNDKNPYLSFPIGTTIDRDIVKFGDKSYKLNTHVGPGLCPMGATGDSCTYTDQPDTTWGYYRVWTKFQKPFAINPQVYTQEGLSIRGMIITKTTPDTTFSPSELNWWKTVLNNVVLD